MAPVITPSDSADAGAWEALPWQEEMLTALVMRKDWPHALMIYGQRGIGKRILALNLAQALLCETPLSSRRACGQCMSCHYVSRGQHPDLRLLEPSILDDEGEAKAVDWITVDRIRELTAFAQLTSHRHRAKVAIIVPAEAMNQQAANALLKTLEEPPENTRLLLVTDHPSRLPATIISRCQRILAPHPSSEMAATWLAQAGVANAGNLLAQAGGAPLVALNLTTAEVQQERLTLLDKLCGPEKLSPVALGAVIEGGPRDQRKLRLGQFLYWMVTWTADLAQVNAGGSPGFHPDYADQLSSLARRVAKLPLFRYHRLLLQQTTLLNHPLSQKWLVEQLMFDYRTLFSKA